MTTLSTLQARSTSLCELCGSSEKLDVYLVPPHDDASAQTCILACDTCRDQIDKAAALDINHWRCLNESMWSQEPPVQVVAWRLLNRLHDEGWARDLLDMLYLDDDTLHWAKMDTQPESEIIAVHKDSNGAVLCAGDTVTLIKDLNVKGAGFTAKRGTAVRDISIVADNAKQIEGRVSGQQIVILTEFVKKS